eukprot:gene25366-31622_t
MAFHVFLVEHLVPSVSEVGYGEAKPGTINSEDAPLKLLTTDAWLLYTPLHEFFHLHFLSLANESLKVEYNLFESISLWKCIAQTAHDRSVDSERLRMSLRLHGLTPQLLPDDDIDQCLSLAMGTHESDAHLTLPQVLYVLELLSDRIDWSSSHL